MHLIFPQYYLWGAPVPFRYAVLYRDEEVPVLRVQLTSLRKVLFNRDWGNPKGSIVEILDVHVNEHF
jgi:hypothetical protein